MPESLKNQFISDLYTSLLHLSGAELGVNGPLNKVFDGAGNSTGLALSGDRVIVNNYIYPRGWNGHTRPPMEWLDAFFPIGCLQLTFDNNDPNTRIAGTTWGLVSEGRFLVGVGTYSDKNGDTYSFCPGTGPGVDDSGNEAGEYRHKLNINEMPMHTHITNVGSAEVQVPSPVGGGEVSESPEVGLVNSTISFARQQQRRNELANKIRWNFGEDYGETGSIVPNNWLSPNNATGYGEYLYPVKYAFDLNFLRGSAKNYPDRDTPNSYFQNNTNWEFKEMIGIWNGETRFIPDTSAGRRNIPAQSSQNGLKDINWYRLLKTMDCFDVGSAEAGEVESAVDNTAELVTGNSSILNTQTGGVNNRESSIVGLGAPHNNIPPSYGVYVWKRLT